MTPELPRAPMSAPKLAAGDALGVRVGAGPLGLVERRPDRGEHVRAGVAVGDREDVERVDLVDVGLEVRDGARNASRNPAPSQAPSGHQATSVPLSARSAGAGSPVVPCSSAGAIPCS